MSAAGSPIVSGEKKEGSKSLAHCPLFLFLRRLVVLQGKDGNRSGITATVLLYKHPVYWGICKVSADQFAQPVGSLAECLTPDEERLQTLVRVQSRYLPFRGNYHPQPKQTAQAEDKFGLGLGLLGLGSDHRHGEAQIDLTLAFDIVALRHCDGEQHKFPGRGAPAEVKSFISKIAHDLKF